MNDSLQGMLSGVRVVELGTFITGPCTGMMLADLGADVIKVESPGGDPYRAYQSGQYSPHFQAYNRNKRSLVLDLKQASDQALLEQLVRQADVFIQNFRPGAAERLGVGAAQLQELNPSLIYCSISGFGASGPYVDRPSYDSVAQALSGFLSVVVDLERPRFMGPALADAITGMYAAYGILGALVERGRTARGRHVSVSMLEAMAHFAVEPFAAYFALGQVPTSRDRPRLAQAHILKTGGGGLLAIHLSSLEKFWQGLLAALEAPELGVDPRFHTRLARIENHEALGEALTAIVQRMPVSHWVERLGTYDVPCAAVNSIRDVLSDPQAQHLELIVPVQTTEGATKSTVPVPHSGPQQGVSAYAVRPAVQVDGQYPRYVRAAPLVDEHGGGIREALRQAPRWPERQPLGS